MCGILGFFGRTDPLRFQAALDRLAHRGPDGQGVYADEGITLGHRRLAILDTSERGRQPLEVLGRYLVCFNGEVYNFKEIRKELEPEGFTYQSESDTEVILYAWVKWKEKCLARFNGMWSLAIWDKVERTLFLSRDRFGKKPLFYAYVDGGIVFGSEMKALFPFLPQVRPSDDFDWCKTHLNEYEGTDKCLIQGIHRFPAGHWAVVKGLPGAAPPGARINPVKFWDTMESLVDVPAKYEDQVARFRELFIDSCALRMRADVPIGTALSGGLDSSAVISTMAHIGRNRPESRMSADWQHAFVATFPGTLFDEKVYAQKVVDHLGIKATFLTIDPAKGIDDLERSLYLFEELYLTSPIPMMEIYRAVREHGVRVTLDGHGADEALSGYGQDVFRAFRDAGLNLGQVRAILDTYKGLIDIDSPQIKKTNYDLGFYVRRMGGKAAWLRFAAAELLGKNPKESIPDKKLGQFNQRLYQLFHQTVLPTLLRNYDRYSMAHGIEIRMPFMDHRLISFLFSLPWTSKVRGGFTKRIVRDAIGPFMPPEVTFRTTKIGFNTPIVDWMKGPWRTYLLDTVASQPFRESTLIDPPAVRTKIEDVITRPDATYPQGESAWAALSPHLWEKAVLGHEGATDKRSLRSLSVSS